GSVASDRIAHLSAWPRDVQRTIVLQAFRFFVSAQARYQTDPRVAAIHFEHVRNPPSRPIDTSFAGNLPADRSRKFEPECASWLMHRMPGSVMHGVRASAWGG